MLFYFLSVHAHYKGIERLRHSYECTICLSVNLPLDLVILIKDKSTKSPKINHENLIDP